MDTGFFIMGLWATISYGVKLLEIAFYIVGILAFAKYLKQR
ncbi:MAG: hypothetical protein VB071_02620 [Lawsonibacter sp.]|nr:hypothetical protein [Lawsonibacter sp.]